MGGGGQSTTTEKADPWVGQQMYLLEGWDRALQTLNNGSGNYARPATTQNAINAYSGVASSPAYQQGLNQTQTFANSGYGASYNWGLGSMGNMAAQGSINPEAQGVLSGLAQNGATDQQALGTLRGLSQSGSTDAQGMDLLRRTTSGEFLNQQNPYFQTMVDQNIAAARPSVDAAFASSGRMGSGAQAAAFADAALNQSNQLGYQNYQQERGYQNAAAGALLAQGNTDAAFRANMAGNILGQGNTDAAMRMNAANALGNMSQQDFASRLQALQGYNSGIAGNADFMAQQNALLPSYATAPAEAWSQAAALENADLQRTSPWGDLSQYWSLVGNGSFGEGKTKSAPGEDQTGAYVGAGLTAVGTIAAAYI